MVFSLWRLQQPHEQQPQWCRTTVFQGWGAALGCRINVGYLAAPERTWATPLKGAYPGRMGTRQAEIPVLPVQSKCLTPQVSWSLGLQMKMSEHSLGASEEAPALCAPVRSQLGRGFLCFLISNTPLTSELKRLLWG